MTYSIVRATGNVSSGHVLNEEQAEEDRLLAEAWLMYAIECECIYIFQCEQHASRVHDYFDEYFDRDLKGNVFSSAILCIRPIGFLYNEAEACNVLDRTFIRQKDKENALMLLGKILHNNFALSCILKSEPTRFHRKKRDALGQLIL
jgi:hypothetical protein